MDNDDKSGQRMKETIRALQGIGTRQDGTLALTPSAETMLQSLPDFPETREPLQNPDGSFRFAPQDDGTLLAGKYGIDSYGRFVPID